MLVRVLMLLVPVVATADSWTWPTNATYYSANKRFSIEVDPNLPSHPQGRASAVSCARGPDGRCTGRRSFLLLNEVAPANVLVSDNGERFVTLDNWGHLGRGDNVVVIYRSDGTVVRKFGLVDLLSRPEIDALPRSTSSVWWGGPHYFNGRNEVVLRVVVNGTMPYEPGVRYGEIRIRLDSGIRTST